MISIKYKYRRSFSAVFLASYLFLVGLSVFHYHHVDITEGNYAYSSETGESGSSPFDKLIDATHECTVQQFANTVLDFNYITIFNQIRNPGVSEIKLKNIVSFTSKAHFKINRLRAPPSFI